MRPLRIVIMGRGSFGRFLASALPKHFPQVRTRCIGGRTKGAALRKALAGADAVVLAVPIRAYEEVAQRVAASAPESAVVVDVATVKEATQNIMRRWFGKRQWISLHPMFGPYSYHIKGGSLSGFTLVVTGYALPPRAAEALRRAALRVGLVLKEMPPKTHDRLLARSLFLTHYIGQIITKAGFSRTPIDTVSFGTLMQAVESVRDDTELFADVYRHNPYCEETIAAFERAENKIHYLLRKCLRR
ncbi:MAG: hypothetical protein KatS3mg099_354 [Candidatus Parcubacteria bacterium]|nr:MAG: hypothetical protein KatS3mg099_354 [Candidatus Parcubacteria bacterium]